MKHNIRISVSKKPKNGGIVTCRTVKIRERFLSWLLGRPCKLTVLVPGDSVDTVSIVELPEGGAPSEPS